jgi:hypothetical protein
MKSAVLVVSHIDVVVGCSGQLLPTHCSNALLLLTTTTSTIHYTYSASSSPLSELYCGRKST